MIYSYYFKTKFVGGLLDMDWYSKQLRTPENYIQSLWKTGISPTYAELRIALIHWGLEDIYQLCFAMWGYKALGTREHCTLKVAAAYPEARRAVASR